MYTKYLKRLFDIIFSVFFLILLSPLLLLVSVVIIIFMGWPIFYTQERPGLNEKVFKIIKFRTMIRPVHCNGNSVPDQLRVTKLGTILRITSIDELPELYNILKGDMSFVGPRPLLVMYLPFYTVEEKIRHTVRPGLTGLAQINGRNLLKWDDRLKLDQEYVASISFSLDIKIIINTFIKTILMKDIEKLPSEFEENLAEYRKNKLVI